MPSQDKLIKQGILLTDNLFDEIAKRLSRGVKASDTLEAFLNQTKDYTTNNPLVLNGYKDKMLELILLETNNHKFSRPAQRELTRATIEKRVGDRIVDVGEDIVQSVRDIVKWGYNNNKSQDDIAEEITHRVEVIKNTRARTIARTEIARTATASDYVINKERGATHYTVGCRNTCCDKCAMEYHGVTNETPDTGSREFLKGNPVEFDIKDVKHLPPLHPNCRCYAKYIIKEGSEVKARKTPYPVQTSTEDNTSAQTIDPNDKRALALALTPEELNAMSFQELSDYFGLKYRGAERDLVRKEVEHMFIEEFEDERRMAIYFDDKAIESYTKKGIATPNEIIAEIMKVPLSLRNETNNISFRDNDEGIYVVNESGNIVRRDLDSNTLGYNATRVMGTDYTHQIIINPRLFKGSRGPGAKLWIPNDEDILRWKKNIHHEFEHSGDQDLELFNSDDYMPHCWSDEYDEVHQKERYFTEYANSDRSESWAEHGGYISYMEANPSEQHRLITIMVYDEQKGFVEKKINYSQYKKEYPLHYKYFMKRHKG